MNIKNLLTARIYLSELLPKAFLVLFLGAMAYGVIDWVLKDTEHVEVQAWYVDCNETGDVGWVDRHVELGYLQKDLKLELSRAVADGNEWEARNIGGRIGEIEARRQNIWDRRTAEMKVCGLQNGERAAMSGWPVTKDGEAVRKIRYWMWEK